MTRPRLLDLFCCAGGAATGYARAGFEVVGVDIKPQPRYPFEFHQADALTFSLDGFDAIHASPPCQPFSKSVKKIHRPRHLDAIVATRELLVGSGLPYVIENVPGAPLLNPFQICGSALALRVFRHRLFESNVPIMGLACVHGWMPREFAPAWNRTTLLRVLSISGGYQKGHATLDEHKAAMGVDWLVTSGELSEMVPPAYTEYIGAQLLAHLARDRSTSVL
ncbi:MAG TPA: DNA cytosine methyltransferase [Gaiellaceae bacterium]|nr:DNA cytosine methyltransferase [Gaiellaceae bacterium]